MASGFERFVGAAERFVNRLPWKHNAMSKIAQLLIDRD
jgi:hypothetical protein